MQRMNGMLRTGGQLYLSDVIFEQGNVHKNIEQWIEKLEKAAGPEIRKDVEAHIRREFSTYDWIMDGLFERANFEIVSKTIHEGVVGRYLCRKTADCAAREGV